MIYLGSDHPVERSPFPWSTSTRHGVAPACRQGRSTGQARFLHMIYLGSDHGGVQLKEKVKKWLKEWNMEFADLGAKTLDSNDDYPEFAFAVAEKVAAESNSPESKSWKDEPKGVLLCRSAAGMVIAANKVPGIRAAAAFDEKSAQHSREHNNANVLAISGDWTDESTAQKIIKAWLATEFSKEARHRRRVDQIAIYETPVGGCCGGDGAGCKCGGDND